MRVHALWLASITVLTPSIAATKFAFWGGVVCLVIILSNQILRAVAAIGVVLVDAGDAPSLPGLQRL